MHVGVEAVGTRSGGGWSVLTRLLASLACDGRIDRITVYCSPSQTWAGEPPRDDRLVYRERLAEHESLPRRVAWFAMELDRTARRDGVDVLLCLNGMGRTSTPHVNVVQQAMIFADAEHRRPPAFAVRLAAIARATRQSCTEAQTVVVQTGSMRACVVREFGTLDVRVVPVGLPEGVPEGPELTDRAGGVLLVTSELPYKNAGRVRQGFASLREERPDLTLDVVGVAWNGEGIVSHGSVSRARLRQMYQRAVLAVVPSLVESMGLPLVEAMAGRCPVVAADRPYARDVCDNAAVYFNPESTSDLVRVAGEVLRDEQLARDLVGRGERRLAELGSVRPGEAIAEILLEAV